MSIKQSLIEEYFSQREEVSKMEVGTQAYEIAMNALTKLADRIIEIEKHEADSDIKWEAIVKEYEHKMAQLEDEKRDRKKKIAVDVGKAALSGGLTFGCFLLAMNFEKTGHIFGTEGGRAALRSLLKFGK